MSSNPLLIDIILHSHVNPPIRPTRVRTIPISFVSPNTTSPCSHDLLDPSLSGSSRSISPHSCLTLCLYVRLGVVVGFLAPPKAESIDWKCWASSDASSEVFVISLGELAGVCLLLFGFASVSSHGWVSLLNGGCFLCCIMWLVVDALALFCSALIFYKPISHGRHAYTYASLIC